MKHIEYTDDKNLILRIQLIAVYMLFGLLWIFTFIQAKADFICMYSASTYYFDSNAQKEGQSQVMKAIRTTYIYHAGSLAFGSLIIGILQLIYIIFILPQKQAERLGDDNPIRKASTKVCQCCLNCFEKLCDYINT